ncbi:MAG: septum formation protein Maf [Chloroflexi bacterium]|nr:septum formation protein Maf [Chloroflexota bacterium]
MLDPTASLNLEPPDAGSRLVLGSASPRRRHLLALLELPFSTAVADVDETPRPCERPDGLALRLAQAKAAALAGGQSAALVLGADTVVALDDRLLAKPADGEEARMMLRDLRGREHRVITGVAVAQAGRVLVAGAIETLVAMREYGDGEIEAYIASGRPFDKAGGYAIQDPTFHPVARIVGCYPNVVGLPLCEARRQIAACGQTPSGPPGPPSGPGGAGVDGRGCDLCVRARAVEPPA